MKSLLRAGAGMPRVAIFLSALAGGLLIVQCWLLAEIASALVFEARTVEQLRVPLLLLLLLYGLRALLSLAADRSAFATAARVKNLVRRDLLLRIHRTGPVGPGRERSGALATLLVEGVETLEDYIARFLPAMALTALLPGAILAITIPMDWITALIMAGTAPLIPLAMILIGRGAERLNQRQWASLTRMGARFLDAIQGLTTLKLFNASRREAETVSRLSEEYRHDTMRILRVAFLSSLALEFLSTLSIAMIAVFIGFRLLWGEMDYQRGLFLLLLAPEFYLPLRNLGVQYHARMNAIAAAGDMIRLLGPEMASVPPDMLPCKPADTPEQTCMNPAGPATAPALGFMNVVARYGDGPPALDGLSMDIRAGETVALIGPSGAGKSTIFNLLLHFMEPETGQILVGDRPLTDRTRESWRSGLAWVPQRPHLFRGTIAQAIALGAPDAPLARIRDAAEQAGALSFIEALPRGFDTTVGERGSLLSGGEVRRIAVARAFLREPALVLLDEPTASLDAETEEIISDALGRLAVGRTVLTIAHRLKTVEQVDRILVLNRGRVVEQGRHADLLLSGGLYASLVQAMKEERGA